MDAQFMAIDSGAAAGLINPDGNADLLLSKAQGFTSILHTATDD